MPVTKNDWLGYGLTGSHYGMGVWRSYLLYPVSFFDTECQLEQHYHNPVCHRSNNMTNKKVLPTSEVFSQQDPVILRALLFVSNQLLVIPMSKTGRPNTLSRPMGGAGPEEVKNRRIGDYFEGRVSIQLLVWELEGSK